MRTFTLTSMALVLLVTAAPSLRAEEQGSTSSVRVIVHPSNPASSLERRTLIEAFLKKTSRWDHGELIRPVDQRPETPARRSFTQDVLGRSMGAVRSYWNQLVFSGQSVPPPELDSEQAVVDFVRKNRGAVGYVTGGGELTGVKVVPVK